MGEAENRELLEHIFARMSEGDLSAMGEAMSDEVSWTFPGDWTWSGTWEPKQLVVDDLMRPLMKQFEDYRASADLILADGDRVVVQAHSEAKTKRGERYDQTYLYIFTVGADGRITAVVEHCDTALVERVLDPPPSRR